MANAVGGLFLRVGAMILRIIQLAAAAVVLGIYSYFLAILADHHYNIPKWERAVEGMSGAAVVYTIFAVLLTLCLGGVAFFGFLAVVLDILFVACFIAIAYYSRHGDNSCTGYVNTPLGSGQAEANAQGFGSNGFGFKNGDDVTYFPKLHYACRLNTVVFALAIINCFLFAITAFYQVALVRHHRKEKRYGPSPDNNYTSGTGYRGFFWNKKRRANNTKDAEAATALPGTNRVSGDTQTTFGNNAHTTEPKFGQPGYGQATNY